VSSDRPVLIGVRASRFRDELAGWIRGQGFATFVTSVARDAVDWLRRTPESISFLDRDLDRVDGEEVWRTVVRAAGPSGGRWSARNAESARCRLGTEGPIDRTDDGPADRGIASDGEGGSGGRRPTERSRPAGRLVLLAERPTKELWLTALGDGVATVLPLPAGQDAVLVALRLAVRN
jgi:hypothetical protein